MSFSKIFLFMFFNVLMLITGTSSWADTTTTTTITKRTITTPTPAAQEVVTAPTGYVKCVTISAGWNNNVWVPEHQVCQYSNSTEGVAWVQGYWACVMYNEPTGECTSWVWKAAHWEKTLVNY